MSANDKTKVDGHVVNKRTAALVKQTKKFYKLLGGTGTVYVTQGSFNVGGVSASAGTHDKGDAVDFSMTNRTDANWNILQHAARWAGFAAWWRKPLYRNGKLVWSHHVHGIVLNGDYAAPLAQGQVRDFKAKPPRDGLAGHAVDNTWRPNPILKPLYPIYGVSYSNSRRVAKGGSPKIAYPGVKRIQSALNARLGTKLVVDGKFGPRTKAAYKKWEIATGTNVADVDGVPGPRNLALLGGGRFNVVK